LRAPLEPPDADRHVWWCESRGRVTAPGYSIAAPRRDPDAGQHSEGGARATGRPVTRPAPPFGYLIASIGERRAARRAG